jgi:phosphoribosyl 1,2-cyclic phosphodiesterase
MRLQFLGVRGSTPAPGRAFAGVGGHTSCVAVADDGPPRLVLDAGTGLRRLSAALDGQPFRGTIILTHLHWDHVQGLPFFAAGDRDDAAVTLLMPAQGSGQTPADVLARAMSPSHFPIGPERLRGDWRFGDLDPGEHTIEGFTVLAAPVPHKGGRTFGYRVSDGGCSLAYIPDHGPRGEGPGPDGIGARHERIMALAKGVDVLAHGAQFTRSERERADYFGHATIEYALALAEEAGVGELVLIQHDPDRTDVEVHELAQQASSRLPDGIAVVAAVEGLELTV